MTAVTGNDTYHQYYKTDKKPMVPFLCKVFVRRSHVSVRC